MLDKKGKIAMTSVLIIFGLILSIQFKTVNKVVGEGNISSDIGEQLQAELEATNAEKEELLKELNALDGKIKEYQNKEANENWYSASISERISIYKTYLGYEEVHGPGITVIIDRPLIEEDDMGYSVHDMVSYDIFLQIINDLNATNAGAEAISINGYRYTFLSRFAEKDSNIFLDDNLLNMPFEVKAIGDPEGLEHNLTIEYGLLWYLENELGFKVKVQKEEDITIPRYNKEILFKYAKPVK